MRQTASGGYPAESFGPLEPRVLGVRGPEYWALGAPDTGAFCAQQMGSTAPETEGSGPSDRALGNPSAAAFYT